MSHTSRSYHFLWLSIALLPLIAISFMLAIPAQDYWWYMRLGRDILAQGAIPLVDTIGYSRAGLPIFYQQWAAGIIFWLTYKFGGATLTYLLRGALIGLSYGMLWRLMRRSSGPRLATILLIALGLSSSNNWAMRPQLFAYPLFAICVWVLFQWQDGNPRFLFLLPLSVLLWANLHGSFALPFVLAGSALIFGKGDRKALLIALGVMVLATMINPYGVGVWKYLVFILNSPSDYLFSVEWKPPTNVGWQLNIFFAWVLIFAPIAAFSSRKLSLLEWVWFLGFGWLALSGIRYVIWFMFLLAVFSAKLLAEWTNKVIDVSVPKIFPAVNYSFAFLLMSLSLIFLPGLRENWWKDAPPLYERSTTPIEAVKWLSAHAEIRGALWNDYAFGSYIEFALPSRPTWIDTRMYHYPPAQWTEYVQVSGAENWQALFDREKINLLALSTASQTKLIQAVENSNQWREEYRDPYAVIFSRYVIK